jgi:aspartate aminotransferase-like enzyme
MREDFLLLNPGPVPVTREVREAMGEPMVSHRSAEFEAVYERAQEQLDYVFTQSTLDESSTAAGGTSLILNGTATMGMEAAVANTVDADGEVVDDTGVVTIVHNETSTGLLNPVPAVGEIAAAHDATFVVDGVTSIGGDEFYVDDWNVDVAVTDAQKALAAPPGLSALYVTGDAEAAIDGDRAPFYQDLDWHLRKAEANQTPFTSAVPLFRGLAVAVEDIREEGMPERIERHREQATAFREAFHAMGLESFPELNAESDYSNTVTAIALPESIRGDESTQFFDEVTDRGVSISGGQAHLGGDIFRVSNMGNLTSEHILRGVRTVGEAMNAVGVDADTEAALETARDILR